MKLDVEPLIAPARGAGRLFVFFVLLVADDVDRPKAEGVCAAANLDDERAERVAGGA